MPVYAARKVRIALLAAVLIFGVLSLVLANAASGLAQWLTGLGVVALIADFVISFLYWRCPGCGRYLPHFHLWALCCEFCGENLE